MGCGVLNQHIRICIKPSSKGVPFPTCTVVPLYEDFDEFQFLLLFHKAVSQSCPLKWRCSFSVCFSVAWFQVDTHIGAPTRAKIAP